MRRVIGVVVFLSLMLFALGCGGGGGGGTNTNAQAGALQGAISLAGRSPSSVEMKIDGVPVEATVNEDGSFEMPGLPPGEHVIEVVADDGLCAGRATFTIQPGRLIKLPPIELKGTGKIAGVVSKKTESGLQPVAGAEVVARADVMVIQDDDGAALVPADAGNSRALIYPPPPGLMYSAFTNDDGTYVMDGVAAGNYFVTVMVPGFEPGWAYVEVEEGKTTSCDFVLEPENKTWPAVGTVRGTVLGECEDASSSPAPIAGAEVVITMREPVPVPLPPIRPRPPVAAREDRDGDDGGSEPPYGGDDWPPDEPIVPPPIIWGRYRTLTDNNGQYSLNVPEGYGTIRVWAVGYEPARDRLFVEANKTVVKDFVLKLAEWVIEPVYRAH